MKSTVHIKKYIPFPKNKQCLFFVVLFSRQVMSDSFETPWTIARQAPLSMGYPRLVNIGVACHFLLQGFFPTQGSNPALPHYRWVLYG